MKIENVELPFFYGFYESPFLNNDLISNIIEEEREHYLYDCGKEYDYDDFTFETENVKREIVNSFTNVFKDYLPSWIKDIENPELWSPQSYNFTTDKIYVTITLADDWKEQIEQLVNENRDWLNERIKKDWTSRSGFASFIRNDLEPFMEEVYNLNNLYISIIMQYDIELKNKNVDMYDRLTTETLDNFNENFSDFMFVSLNKDENEEVNENGTQTENTTNNI